METPAERALVDLGESPIVGVDVNDYSIDIEGGALQMRGEAQLFNLPSQRGWTALGMHRFEGDKLMPVRDAEVDKLRIIAWIKSLAKAKSVGLEPVPGALHEPLAAGSRPITEEEGKSLQNHGFYVKTGGTSGATLMATEGSIAIRQKDGVVWRILFGKLADRDDRASDEPGKRYLLVTVGFDDSPVPDGDRTTPEFRREIATVFDKQTGHGEQRAKELAARFGDSYTIVSEDVFKTVRLGLDDVVQKKAGQSRPVAVPPRAGVDLSEPAAPAKKPGK
jgi:hypothetical protein